MFGRTGQMFPRRAYHDAIYEEEYGSETEEDCCRGRGLSAILCWFLSVIVLVGVAASVVLTVFFILKSRSASSASGLEELNIIFDQDTGFSAVPTTPAEIPSLSSASSEDDESTATSTFSSSSRRPPVYIDSNEYRYRGSTGGSTTGDSPQFPSPSTFSTRNSGPTRMTTRKYYSDTTDQSMEDVISKTTPIPPTTTTQPNNNVFKFLMNTIKTFQNSDEFTPSQSASESLEKAILPIDHVNNSEENNREHRGTTVTRSPITTYKSHGTTLFTSAPSSGSKPQKPRNKSKPFALYPTDGEKSPGSSSEEITTDTSTIPPSFDPSSFEDSSRFPSSFLELPSAKKVPPGVKASAEDLTTPTTPTISTIPTTSRSEDMLTKIILRNKNTAGGTTKRTFVPTTIPPRTYDTSSENDSKEDRRPGKARTVIYKTTTTAIPSNVVLVTPTTTESSSEESRDRPPFSSPSSSSIEALDHPRHDTTKSPWMHHDHHQNQDTSSSESSEETPPQSFSTNRPKANESNEFLDILVGSEDSKTLITKQTDSGVFTSAILPPWFNSNGESNGDANDRSRNDSSKSSTRKPELFRQPDLTALLDILSAPDGNNSAKSETYNVKEMNTEASQKAERLKHLEEELKPVFSSPSGLDQSGSHSNKFSVSDPKETHRPGDPPSIGSPATNAFHYGMDDGKTNIYGFFPDDDLEGEESAEQLQIEISPNRPPPPKNLTEYDNSSEQSEDDHIIDIAYDSKTRPEIQLEVGGDSLESAEEEEEGPTGPQRHHFGQRAPLHGTDHQGQSFPDKHPATPPAPSNHHHSLTGDIPSASETTNAVQPPPPPPSQGRPSAEEEYESDKRLDWSIKTPSTNLTSASNLPLNSLEEYSEEDPNYALASMEAAELNLQRQKDKLSDQTPPPPPPTTTAPPTTQKPKTKVIQVFSEPYVPTKDTPAEKSTTLSPEEYEYSNESPESNKTGFSPPAPISFHESVNSFQTPEYNSKDGWRPLVLDRRGNSDISDLKPSGSVKFRGSTQPPSPNRRPVTTPIATQSSEYHEYEVEGQHLQHQQHQPQPQASDQDSWAGIVPSFNNNPQSPAVNMVPPPQRMKFPEAASEHRPTIKVPQPQRSQHHHTHHGIDRSKYMQRPAVPPIIMRRLPQIQQNPTQNTQPRGDGSLNQNPHVAPPMRHIHRGPQFLPNMAPAPNIRPGPPGPQGPSSPGNIQWPSEGQNNAIRRNSHYLMNQNQRRQG